MIYHEQISACFQASNTHEMNQKMNQSEYFLYLRDYLGLKFDVFLQHLAEK
jgi:hypothetical protein